MNDKFFALPIEKQRRIINAVYRVFSENSYKKAPMSEIAEEGSISKSLLFHYFTNKKDLYMYLWDNACEITTQAIREYKQLDTDDFF
ncbi:MAG: TetR/AcrR family transcriptional regulator [Acutalibacteraceae bacterium]|nr:TetR/AcrR family transcriptional regulator [Acutalibacteraceae bacterium]